MWSTLESMHHWYPMHKVSNAWCTYFYIHLQTPQEHSSSLPRHPNWYLTHRHKMTCHKVISHWMVGGYITPGSSHHAQRHTITAHYPHVFCTISILCRLYAGSLRTTVAPCRRPVWVRMIKSNHQIKLSLSWVSDMLAQWNMQELFTEVISQESNYISNVSAAHCCLCQWMNMLLWSGCG